MLEIRALKSMFKGNSVVVVVVAFLSFQECLGKTENKTLKWLKFYPSCIYSDPFFSQSEDVHWNDFETKSLVLVTQPLPQLLCPPFIGVSIKLNH